MMSSTRIDGVPFSLALLFIIVVLPFVSASKADQEGDLDTTLSSNDVPVRSSESVTDPSATNNLNNVQRLQIGVKKRVDNCLVKSKKGDLLHINYVGTLAEDGTQFDSSYDRKQPLSFTLGAGQVIKGWDQGLLGMCEGEKRKLIIPPSLGYGSSGAPPKIPGDAVLIFEAELMLIERRNAGEL